MCDIMYCVVITIITVIKMPIGSFHTMSYSIVALLMCGLTGLAGAFSAEVNMGMQAAILER